MPPGVRPDSPLRHVRTGLADVPLWLRLVTSLLLLLSLSLAVTGVVAATSLRQYLVDRIDTQLTGFASGPGGGALDGRRQGRGRGLGGPDELNAYYIAYAGPDGAPLQEAIRTAQSPPDLPPLTSALLDERGNRPFTVRSVDGDGRWRVVVRELRNDNGYAAVGLSMADVDETVSRLVLIDVVVGLGVLLLLAGGTIAVIRSSLRPLVEVEHTAAAIAAGDLTRRVPERSARTEVGRLSRALNGMLGQIEHAFGAQRASETAARESEQRMRRFVADASHELRTPLTSIRGFAELYRQGAVSNPAEVGQVMRRVEDEAARMGLLVEELLLLARLDQARPLESAPVDLLALVGDAVHDARAVARDRVVEMTLSGTVPPVVLGDAARLRQVLANLLSNARTHTTPGTPIRVTVGTADGAAFVQVADEGPGLTAEEAAHVFDRFYRADAARTRATGGSGLGLSIAAAIVHAHGGRVGVTSPPGQGARFRLELPLVEPVRTGEGG